MTPTNPPDNDLGPVDLTGTEPDQLTPPAAPAGSVTELCANHDSLREYIGQIERERDEAKARSIEAWKDADAAILKEVESRVASIMGSPDNEIARLTASRNVFRDERDALQAERNTLRSQLAHARSRGDDKEIAEQERDGFMSQLADARIQVERLEGERNAAVQQTATEITERQKAEADVTRLLIIEGELKRENDRLAAELAAVTKERDSARLSLTTYMQSVDERDAACRAAGLDYTEVRKVLNQTLSEDATFGLLVEVMRRTVSVLVEQETAELKAQLEEEDRAAKGAVELMSKAEAERDAARAELAAIKAGAVTDEMVERAQRAAGFGIGDDEMRAALQTVVGAGTQAARDLLAERERQKNAEGWTPEHDDEHGDGSLATAAACYALGDRQSFHDTIFNDRFRVPDLWPQSWNDGWWKPKDRRRDLVRAGALILAEIERLDRRPTGKGEVKP